MRQGPGQVAIAIPLEAIGAFPEVRPIKVNAIAMRDFTEGEVMAFCDFARSTDYQVRFIEFMPLDADRAWEPDSVLTGEEIRQQIEAVHPLEELPREPSATARVYRFADGTGEIGFINPVSEPFCADCNRLRLTAEGKLHGDAPNSNPGRMQSVGSLGRERTHPGNENRGRLGVGFGQGRMENRSFSPKFPRQRKDQSGGNREGENPGREATSFIGARVIRSLPIAFEFIMLTLRGGITNARS